MQSVILISAWAETRNRSYPGRISLRACEWRDSVFVKTVKPDWRIGSSLRGRKERTPLLFRVRGFQPTWTPYPAILYRRQRRCSKPDAHLLRRRVVVLTASTDTLACRLKLGCADRQTLPVFHKMLRNFPIPEIAKKNIPYTAIEGLSSMNSFGIR